MFKILCIGNSFSCDAVEYLKDICACGGINDVFIHNMSIGGCSLERHVGCLKSGAYEYSLGINAKHARSASLPEEIKAYDWDVITLQQASHFSGMYDTYQPFLDELASFIREHKPNAKIYWYKTWAYEKDSKHGGFANYDNNQETMADAIDEAAKKAAEFIGAPIIPSGDVIRELRKLPEFDHANGGQSLCRDGFHMHLFYGRYAVAATWFETLFGGDIRSNPFIPPVDKIGAITPDVMHKLELIKDTVHKVCAK